MKVSVKQHTKNIIYLKIFHKGKPSYISTGYTIPSEFWDKKLSLVKKNFPDHALINAAIQKKKTDVNTMLLKNDAIGIPSTILKIKRMFHGDKGNRDFFDNTETMIKELTGKHSDSTIGIYKNCRDKLRKYMENRPLSFADIDVKFLRKYEAWLRSDVGNQANNSVHKQFKFLKKVFNYAIKGKVIRQEDYPFGDHDGPIYKDTDRTYLTKEEVARVEELLDKRIPREVRYVTIRFLLGCYSGLRVSDWVNFDMDKHVVGSDRLLLRAQKNGKLVSIKITKKIAPILDMIKDSKPEDHDYHYFNVWLKLAGSMAGIGKTLTTHVARHSFAVRCCELDLSPSTTATLMGISMKTVMIYYKITDRKIDMEMEKWNEL